jgi:hypothetical protein
MSISNNQNLRLKKMLVNGRNQTIYHPKVYRAKELPQFLVDENEDFIEVVTPEATIIKDQNSVTLQGEGVSVKTINNVVTKPEEPKPEAQEIKVEPPVEKVVVKRGRRKTEEV